jgi:putative ABC transport system ATP-binding protein
VTDSAQADKNPVVDDLAVIELTDVEKIYRVGTEIVRALRGVSVTIEPNEFVAIMGPPARARAR